MSYLITSSLADYYYYYYFADNSWASIFGEIVTNKFYLGPFRAEFYGSRSIRFWEN